MILSIVLGYFPIGFVLVCLSERFDKEPLNGFVSAVILWPLYFFIRFITSSSFDLIDPWGWLDWLRYKIRGFE